MRRPTRNPLRHIWRYAGRYAAAAFIGLAGFSLMALTNASTLATSKEVESASMSRGDMVVADSTASGNSAVRFGQANSNPTELAFMSFGGAYSFISGSSKTINGITLRLTTGGDFQVVNSAGAILWRTNTSANCSTASNCRVVLQSDGNYVLYGPNGALWSTGTYNVSYASVIFQPAEPFLTLRGNEYEVVWTSSGTTSTGAPGMLVGGLKSPQAPSVQSFIDSLAVNSHMDQYEGDAARVYDKLSYLGIKTIRDHYAENGSLYNQYAYLAERGIRFNMIHYSDNFDVLVRDAATLAGLPNKPLIAVEGPNEINNFKFTCNGSTWQGGWNNDNGPAAKCFMENFYSRIRSDARFNGIPVYNLTGGNSANNADAYGLFGLDKQADLGNIHPYPSPSQQPHNNFLAGLGDTYFTVPPNKAVITETGYQTSKVGQRAQALYYMNLYLDAFKQGFKKTYIYELTDNAYETHGFYDTNNNPKASARALHNMTYILADTGTPRTGSLNHSVTGGGKQTYSMALQRSNGNYNLIIWDERPIWNNGDVTPAVANVTANLGRNFSSVKVYKPLNSVASTQTVTNVSTLNLQLTGEPMILELVP